MNRFVLLLIVVVTHQAGCRLPACPVQEPRESAGSPALFAFSEAPAAQEHETHAVEDFVQMGLARNPRIEEAIHRIEAARYRIPQALALPDPMVMTSTHLAPVQTAAGEQAFALGISQKFTNADRRATQAAVFEREVAAAEAELAAVRLEIATDIRTACYQMRFIRQSIEITRADQHSLDQIVEVIERQYEVDREVTQQDILNAQIEQSQLANQIAELRQREKSAEARLVRLVQREPGTLLGVLNEEFAPSDGVEPAPAEGGFDVQSLVARALLARPDLQGRIAAIERDQQRVQLARLEYRPDWTVGLNWIATSSSGLSPVANGDDAMQLNIGFNLPVYRERIRAGVCEAESERRASESRFQSLRDEAAEEVVDLVARLESTRSMLELVSEDIVPKAERTLDVSIDQYATGTVNYIQLIENWRSLLGYRITEARLRSQYDELLAELARSVGQIEPASPILVPPSLDGG